MPRQPSPRTAGLTRRDLLQHVGGGFAGLALAALLDREGLLAAEPTEARGAGTALDSAAHGDEARGGLHHPARATRVIQLFMSGAASQVDTFDYKPVLIERDGEPFNPGGKKIELFQSQPGACFKSPWSWKQYGECGKWISSLVPHLAECVDRMMFFPSMQSKSAVHGPATYMQATGFVLPGFPSMGSWVSYGLGSLNENLPTFVALPDSRGFAPNGPSNWGAGFLPAAQQGTMIRPGATNPIQDLFPPADRKLTPDGEREGRDLLAQLNRDHLRERPDDSRLDARIASYELAARLQLSAPEVLDVSQETAMTQRAYGLEDPVTADFGRNCLIARRLVERGVRFVQVWSGADNGFPRRNWDSHEDIARDHADMGRSMDQPAAALVRDLADRGLLDETIVIWTTEFGRMPCRQGGKGRDHNPDTFTSWVAGGGFRGGTTYGASDEWSFRAAENPIYCYDLHATVLHQLGIDHERLTFRHNGIDRRLTDVHGRVIEEVLS